MGESVIFSIMFHCERLSKNYLLEVQQYTNYKIEQECAWYITPSLPKCRLQNKNVHVDVSHAKYVNLALKGAHRENGDQWWRFRDTAGTGL